MIVSTGTIMNSTWGYTLKNDTFNLPITANPNLAFAGSANWLPITNFIKAPNGNYYSVPGTQRTVLKYTPNFSISGSNTNYETGSFTILSASIDGGTLYLQSGGEKYGHGVLAQNGKIYAFPYRSTTAFSSSILEIDPTIDAYKMYNYTWTGLDIQMFLNCVLGGDGWIYGSPNNVGSANAHRVFRFHPETKILQSSSLLSGIGWAVSAQSLIATGSYVYFIPRRQGTGNLGKMLKLDTNQFLEGTTNGMSLINFPAVFQLANWGNNISFQGSSVISSSQGYRVMLTPRLLGGAITPLTSSLFFNPADDTFTIVKNQSGSSTSGIIVPNNRFVGGNGSINGNINLFSFSTDPQFNITVKHSTTSSVLTNVAFPNRYNLIPPAVAGNSFTPFALSPSEKYKSLYVYQIGDTVASRYTSSLISMISVKGYYNGVTDFSIPDYSYLTPNPIASITSSLFNFYYNHL
jgi:hypothetical protein